MGFQDMHELQQRQMEKLGNKGIKGAEEIIEVGTICNLEFSRWNFKVAIRGSGQGSWLNSILLAHDPVDTLT